MRLALCKFRFAALQITILLLEQCPEVLLASFHVNIRCVHITYYCYERCCTATTLIISR